MRPQVVAGCPASGRSWIIKQWVSHLQRAAEEADVSLSLYLLAPDHDTQLIDYFEEACSTNGILPVLSTIEEKPREDVREWNPDRYQIMADLRNTMLRDVRLLQPDYFLSIDSDILIGKKVLKQLIEDVGSSDFDAVGGKTWLAVGPRQTGKDGRPPVCHVVNYANLNSNGNLLRRDQEGFFKVDVLMALKLMTPSAYYVDYEAHRQGEDIGWSLACKQAGVKLGWDGRVRSKHCMVPEDLHRVDDRVGW